MVDIRSHIEPESEALLASLLGKQIVLRSSGASISPGQTLLNDVWIIKPKGHAVHVSESWYDTERLGVDVFDLKISKRSKQEVKKAALPVMIETDWPCTVEAIHIIECFEEDEIIEGQDVGQKDIVRFDGGIAFDMSDKTCFKIGIEASIAGRFSFRYIRSHEFYVSLREWRIRKTLNDSSIH